MGWKMNLPSLYWLEDEEDSDSCWLKMEASDWFRQIEFIEPIEFKLLLAGTGIDAEDSIFGQSDSILQTLFMEVD